MRKLVVGNWKMNGLSSDLEEIGKIADIARERPGVDCGLCLPATLLVKATNAYPDFTFGGQDCHIAASGAHTGCISADMLLDAGASMTIVGHSERRTDQGESDSDVRGKAIAANAAGLSVIVCVGETEKQRDGGRAVEVVLGQLDGSLPDSINFETFSTAYEPVWAVGTGKIPTEGDLEEMHAAIRGKLVSRYGDAGHTLRILYGGSLNAGNADSLFAIANVDGGLIGGASLTADKFVGILDAAIKSEGDCD